jgi:shikimate kinase
MQPSIILIGHRTSGKSILGSALAGNLGCAFHDIDTLIEQESGEAADVLVTRDESAFRARERALLDRVLREHPSAVVAPGAGISEIPSGHIVVWIYREGWEESAQHLRRRLRPEMRPDEEFQWMRETRERRYRVAAHYRLRRAGSRIPARAHRPLAAGGRAV